MFIKKENSKSSKDCDFNISKTISNPFMIRNNTILSENINCDSSNSFDLKDLLNNHNNCEGNNKNDFFDNNSLDDNNKILNLKKDEVSESFLPKNFFEDLNKNKNAIFYEYEEDKCEEIKFDNIYTNQINKELINSIEQTNNQKFPLKKSTSISNIFDKNNQLSSIENLIMNKSEKYSNFECYKHYNDYQNQIVFENSYNNIFNYSHNTYDMTKYNSNEPDLYMNEKSEKENTENEFLNFELIRKYSSNNPDYNYRFETNVNLDNNYQEIKDKNNETNQIKSNILDSLFKSSTIEPIQSSTIDIDLEYNKNKDKNKDEIFIRKIPKLDKNNKEINKSSNDENISIMNKKKLTFSKFKDDKRNSFVPNVLFYIKRDTSCNNEVKEKCKCKCKNSHCIKLYCECFNSSKYCFNCECPTCFNSKEYESIRSEAINKLLHKKKAGSIEALIKTNQNIKEKGCKCKNSSCLKNYCECFQIGNKCSDACLCIGCKNGKNCNENHQDAIYNNDLVLQES